MKFNEILKLLEEFSGLGIRRPNMKALYCYYPEDHNMISCANIDDPTFILTSEDILAEDWEHEALKDDHENTLIDKGLKVYLKSDGNDNHVKKFIRTKGK